MKTFILLSVAAFSFSAFASDHLEKSEFDFKSIKLVRATMECGKEYSDSIAEIRGPNAALIDAQMTEGGQHDFDHSFTLKFGYAHPMVGVVKTKKLVIDRLFHPAHCPKGAMDCGGGTYETVCTKSDINERN